MTAALPVLSSSRKVRFIMLRDQCTYILVMTPATPNEPSGTWDSIHVFETAERGRNAHYKLTSTVMLQLTTRNGSDEAQNVEKGTEGWKRDGEVSLSGSMTRQVSISIRNHHS